MNEETREQKLERNHKKMIELMERIKNRNNNNNNTQTQWEK